MGSLKLGMVILATDFMALSFMIRWHLCKLNYDTFDIDIDKS